MNDDNSGAQGRHFRRGHEDPPYCKALNREVFAAGVLLLAVMRNI